MSTVKELIILGSKSPVNSYDYKLGIELGIQHLYGQTYFNDEWPPVEKVYENPLDDFIDEFGGVDEIDLYNTLYYALQNKNYVGEIILKTRIPVYAFMHAVDTIKGRWLEAEGIIKQDPHWRNEYNKWLDIAE